MAKILILGGYGFTGRLLARYLLKQSEAQILLAGRHLEKAQTEADQLNIEFKGERVSALYADTAVRQSLDEALRKVDLLLVAAPTRQHAQTVIHAALESKVDYLDLQLDARKLALLKSLAPQIERAGCCFITEARFHPGLPAAMIRYAASHLDRLETALIAGYLNMGRTLPYSESVDELMETFKNYQGQVFKNGQWTKTSSLDIRKIDFGGEIGIRSGFSLFFEELRALPERYPTLKEAGFYMSETHWLVDWVITPLVFAGLKLAPRRGIRPLGKLMWWGMRTFPKPPHLVLLKAEANGEKNSKPVKVEIVLSHPDGYELTAIPVVACLRQYLDGSVRRPGLWMMGHLVEPIRLFNDIESMGVQITRVIG
jgi:saccharopine dehydrogenase (NAD+, L-lysine-forming)